MQNYKRFGLLPLALCAALLSACASYTPPPVKPKLVVFLVVDGLPMRQVTGYRDQLAADGHTEDAVAVRFKDHGVEVSGTTADKLVSTGAINLTGATLTVTELAAGPAAGPAAVGALWFDDLADSAEDAPPSTSWVCTQRTIWSSKNNPSARSVYQ